MNSTASVAASSQHRIHWVQSIPFFLLHVVAFVGPFFVPFRWTDVALCLGLYYLRMFAITAGYHRYFSHRAYKAGRVMQFLIGLLGTTAAQKGPLWWAAHHRHHHRESDTVEDIHSPLQSGFWWSHVGWILSTKYNDTRFELIKDFARFPELRWLNKYNLVPPTILAVVIFLIGGWSSLIWGFFLSTVLLWHGTFTINSLAHVFGRRRYKTTDTSRNNWLLALITCGEGWHNNHHYHQNTANQGWFWYEVDFSFYGLKALSWVGLVSDLRMPSDSVKYAYLKYTPDDRQSLNVSIRKMRARARAAIQGAGDQVREAIDNLPGGNGGPAHAPMIKR